MNPLLLRYTTLLMACFAVTVTGNSAPGTREKHPAISDEEVVAIVDRAKSNPDALWELKEAPLEKTFLPLWETWGMGEGLSEQHANSRRRGDDAEREWLKTQKEVGRDYETTQRTFPIAKEILLNHPEFESFVTASLLRDNNRLTDFYSNPGAPRKYEFSDPRLEHPSLLFLATKVPGNAAFRIVGSFLSSPYFPPKNRGDYIETSPASAAQGTLANLVRERLWETIPKDIEGARKWWAENQYRFAATPSENKPPSQRSPDNTVTSQTSPLSGQAAVAGTTSASGNKTWIYAGLTGLLVMLCAAIWLYGRSGTDLTN